MSHHSDVPANGVAPDGVVPPRRTPPITLRHPPHVLDVPEASTRHPLPPADDLDEATAAAVAAIERVHRLAESAGVRVPSVVQTSARPRSPQEQGHRRQVRRNLGVDLAAADPPPLPSPTRVPPRVPSRAPPRAPRRVRVIDPYYRRGAPPLVPGTDLRQHLQRRHRRAAPSSERVLISETSFSRDGHPHVESSSHHDHGRVHHRGSRQGERQSSRSHPSHETEISSSATGVPHRSVWANLRLTAPTTTSAEVARRVGPANDPLTLPQSAQEAPPAL